MTIQHCSWTEDEEKKLQALVNQLGATGNWTEIAAQLGTGRSPVGQHGPKVLQRGLAHSSPCDHPPLRRRTRWLGATPCLRRF